MNASKDRHRIVIAITESSPVPELWRAAMQFLSDSQAELVVLFIDDDRWRRAASLPFTREISRIGGAPAEFTVQRAEQINKEEVSRTRRRIEQLASDADLALAFEVLSESDQGHIQNLIRSGQDVLIAPAFIAGQPIYTYITRLDCQILLVDAKEE